MVRVKHWSVISLFLCAFVTGCGTTKTVIKEVPVPVVQKVPEPPPYEKPKLPIHDLEDGDEPNKVAEAYAQSIKILMDKVKEAIVILDGYRTE